MNLEQKLLETIKYDEEHYKFGFNNMLRPRFVSANDEEKSFVLEFDIHEWQHNPRGDLHGGIVSGMFDLALGYGAVVASDGFGVATADLNVSFLDRVPGDDKLLFKVTIQKSGRMLIRLRGDAICKTSGKLSATAMATFVPLKKPF